MRRDGVGAPDRGAQRDGDAARLYVVRDGRVEERRVTPGIVEGDAVEIRTASPRAKASSPAPPPSCARATASARCRSDAPADERAARATEEAGPMRLNVSAWSIRQPIPAVVAFAVLTILGLVSFRTMPITPLSRISTSRSCRC